MVRIAVNRSDVALNTVRQSFRLIAPRALDRTSRNVCPRNKCNRRTLRVDKLLRIAGGLSTDSYSEDQRIEAAVHLVLASPPRVMATVLRSSRVQVLYNAR